jgi:hypothetical protein
MHSSFVARWARANDEWRWNGVDGVEEKAKSENDRRSPLWTELQEKAKDDPELAEKLETARRVIERYSEALQRLADS